MKYSVKYQLHDAPVGRWHTSLAAAIREMRRCQRAGHNGGDCQGISLVCDCDDDCDCAQEIEQAIYEMA